MKQHIFVATDGSDTAMRAVDLAAEIAAKFDVPLTVGHVLHFGRPAEELARMADVEHMVERVGKTPGVNLPNLPDTMLNLFAETRAGDESIRLITLVGDDILQRGADRAKDLGAKTVKTSSSQGDTADAILDMAQEAGADMIVIGHRGLGRLKRAVLGSVAQKVLNHAECTVVSVR
ncbi:MAG: universal stress protein [Pseudomonadota bacterium]|uniref:universal stress protein n=1 Tax=Roseovarius TaxID=74030 RepID=UPI0022A898D8|nr:universal stress protein [Roseovarius sp. EGI FJ00037]MCZ0813298.1 universal stress protein [Roseovarius sp. EGI FJ00037]